MAQSLDPVSISFYDSCSNLSLGMCGNLLRKVESSISVECPTMSVCLSSLSVSMQRSLASALLVALQLAYVPCCTVVQLSSCAYSCFFIILKSAGPTLATEGV